MRDIKFRKVGKRSNNFKDYASTILERCSEAGWDLTVGMCVFNMHHLEDIFLTHDFTFHLLSIIASPDFRHCDIRSWTLPKVGSFLKNPVYCPNLGKTARSWTSGAFFVQLYNDGSF